MSAHVKKLQARQSGMANVYTATIQRVRCVAPAGHVPGALMQQTVTR